MRVPTATRRLSVAMPGWKLDAETKTEACDPRSLIFTVSGLRRADAPDVRPFAASLCRRSDRAACGSGGRAGARPRRLSAHRPPYWDEAGGPDLEPSRKAVAGGPAPLRPGLRTAATGLLRAAIALDHARSAASGSAGTRARRCGPRALSP